MYYPQQTTYYIWWALVVVPMARQRELPARLQVMGARMYKRSSNTNPTKTLVYIVVVTTMCILFFQIHVRILKRANSVALTTYGAHYGPQLGFPYNNPTAHHYPHRRDILAPITWRRAGSSLWRAMGTTTFSRNFVFYTFSKKILCFYWGLKCFRLQIKSIKWVKRSN
jgi:hypothetical protein